MRPKSYRKAYEHSILSPPPRQREGRHDDAQRQGGGVSCGARVLHVRIVSWLSLAFVVAFVTAFTLGAPSASADSPDTAVLGRAASRVGDRTTLTLTVHTPAGATVQVDPGGPSWNGVEVVSVDTVVSRLARYPFPFKWLILLCRERPPSLAIKHFPWTGYHLCFLIIVFMHLPQQAQSSAAGGRCSGLFRLSADAHVRS